MKEPLDFGNLRMAKIVLTNEQAAVVAGAEEPVAVCRPDGSVAGWIRPDPRFVKPEVCPFTPEEVAAAEKEADSPGPWYTTQQVLEHLRSLDQPQP
jgi:hypothetical protein